MTINQLLEKLEYTCVQGNLDREITAVVYDSRKIVEDCMFICIEGANFDGHSVAAEAAQKGDRSSCDADGLHFPAHQIPDHNTLHYDRCSDRTAPLLYLGCRCVRPALGHAASDLGDLCRGI